MKTIVNFELAKSLKEKGFDLECYDYYTLEYSKKTPFKTKGTGYQSDGYVKFDWNCNSESAKSIEAPYPNRYHVSQCSAPKISEVIMWLYEKHGIWISVTCDCGSDELFTYSIYCTEIGIESCLYNGKNYDSPTKAYQEAILYTLKTLI